MLKYIERNWFKILVIVLCIIASCECIILKMDYNKQQSKVRYLDAQVSYYEDKCALQTDMIRTYEDMCQEYIPVEDWYEVVTYTPQYKDLTQCTDSLNRLDSINHEYQEY